MIEKTKKNILFLIILLFFLIFSLIFPISQKVYTSSFTSNSFEADFATGQINQRLGEMCIDELKNRTAGSSGEKKMAKKLVSFMQTLELEKLPDKENYFETFSFGKGLLSQNVVGLINNFSKYFVVIGAHYDSIFVEQKSFGYSDNLSGVVGVMYLAEMLKNCCELNFNVVVAFYGAEEIGCIGSKYFVENLSEDIKNNTLLSINLDSIGAGDYLYYYHSDFATHYGNFLNNFLQGEYKNASGKYQTNLLTNEANYSALALNSDNSSFLKKGYNSLFFFAGNCDNTFGYTETKNAKKIMHKADTKEHIDNIFGESFVLNIKKIVLSCKSLLTNDGFNETNFAPNQLNPIVFSDLVLKFIGFGLVNLLFIGYVIWINKSKRFSKKTQNN